jgi:hypothetical protein
MAVWTLQDGINVINKEIAWCVEHREDETRGELYSNGFIGGLEQARYLLKQMQILR